jgi:hypothetical protein
VSILLYGVKIPWETSTYAAWDALLRAAAGR